MIFIGYNDLDKRIEINRYQSTHDIHKIVVISANEFPLPIPDTDQITYSDAIMYVTFYRLLQEIDQHTLIVINECLRTQNRYDLTYNCIRNYLNQTDHQLIFQYLPQIDTQDDFMILFDFATRSRWKRQKFDVNLILDNTQVQIHPLPLNLTQVDIPTSQSTKKKYDREKARRLASIGASDPHTIPRNLYLIGGMDKRRYIDQKGEQLSLFSDNGHSGNMYVARNKRLNRENVVTYKDVTGGKTYVIVEFPHRFIDFGDFIRRTGQANSQVLVADLKVDHWYFNRYHEWKDRIHETYTDLQQQ